MDHVRCPSKSDEALRRVWELAAHWNVAVLLVLDGQDVHAVVLQSLHGTSLTLGEAEPPLTTADERGLLEEHLKTAGT